MSPPTEVAGRYRIERRLGAGGMSTVFLATDTVLERPVAVKLLAEHLADDEDFVARFRREALAAARLQHPNIVQVFDSGQDPASERHYIVMEYVDGPSCADMLREHKQLDIDETVAARARRLPRARLRPPRRRRAPRREARQPPDRRGDAHHQARRLRHRQGRRADPHHPGGLGARHGRLPVARAGARRGGRAGVGHLLARACAPTSSSPAGCRTSTRRSPSWRSSSSRTRSRRSPTTGPRCRRSWTRPCALCLEREPEARYATALEMAQAIEAGARGEVTDVTRSGWRWTDTDATRAHAGAHAATGHRSPRACRRAPPAPRPRSGSRRERARGRRRPRAGGAAGAGSAPSSALLAAIAAIVVVGGRSAVLVRRRTACSRSTTATCSSRSTGCATSSASTRASRERSR